MLVSAVETVPMFVPQAEVVIGGGGGGGGGVGDTNTDVLAEEPVPPPLVAVTEKEYVA